MSLDALRRFLGPPQVVARPAAEDWDAVESQLCQLPRDYKLFIAEFGTGSFDQFLWLFSPFTKNKHLNLLEQAPVRMEAFTEMKAIEPREAPFGVYPAKDGLLPFGASDNGDVLYWITRGHPNEWRILVHADREPEYEQFALDMTDFLSAILSREIRCTVFPEEFPSGDPRFRSFQEAG